MRILVDPHVHVYDCFPLAPFLDAAYANFLAQARKECAERFVGILILTESRGLIWFEEFKCHAESGEPIRGAQGQEWHCAQTGEKLSVTAQSTDGARLILTAGRQIVTNEKLEVLALLTDTIVPDGISLSETVETINAQGALAVVPWGFGKWWGKRGKILSEFLLTQSPHNFFLGDNSGRPACLPYPIQFTQARQLGLRILPGSDPLPIPSEYRRPGVAGFSLTADLSEQTPAEDLKCLLRNPYTNLTPYHSPDSVLRFIRNFLALRLGRWENQKSPL